MPRKPRQRLILLGPQRLAPTVGAVVAELGLKGPVACVTAGWQEREDETDELHEVLGVPAVDLRLYHRCEAVYAEDPELFAAHRAKQDRLKARQNIYRLRLEGTLDAARKLQTWQGEPELVASALASALEAVRRLDAEHLAQVAAEHAAFDKAVDLENRPVVAKQRADLANIIDACEAIAIAGGHVAALSNRMRLFALGPILATRPIIAWSAGAMSISERIVLYHDHPPQGRGNAEVLDVGLGLARHIVPLPHARHRVDLDDRQRVGLFARRFQPAVSVILDERARVDWTGKTWQGALPARRLLAEGDVAALEAS